MKKLLLLLIVLFACKERESECFICKTEVYVNGTINETMEKSNLYCDLTYKEANKLEQLHDFRYYDENDNLVETNVTCRVLVSQ